MAADCQALIWHRHSAIVHTQLNCIWIRLNTLFLSPRSKLWLWCKAAVPNFCKFSRSSKDANVYLGLKVFRVLRSCFSPASHVVPRSLQVTMLFIVWNWPHSSRLMVCICSLVFRFMPNKRWWLLIIREHWLAGSKNDFVLVLFHFNLKWAFWR